MEAYNIFTEQSIFHDKLINVYCNKLFNFINNNTPNPDTVLIGGSVAAHLQGNEVSFVKDIDIIVTNLEQFEFLHNELSNIFALPVTDIKEHSSLLRFWLKTDKITFEFWFIDKPANRVVYNGILLEPLSEIQKHR